MSSPPCLHNSVLREITMTCLPFGEERKRKGYIKCTQLFRELPERSVFVLLHQECWWNWHSWNSQEKLRMERKNKWLLAVYVAQAANAIPSTWQIFQLLVCFVATGIYYSSQHELQLTVWITAVDATLSGLQWPHHPLHTLFACSSHRNQHRTQHPAWIIALDVEGSSHYLSQQPLWPPTDGISPQIQCFPQHLAQLLEARWISADCVVIRR